MGTLLIALEFVRGAKLIQGIQSLQALVGMLLTWPFKSYINARSSERNSVKVKEPKGFLAILFIVGGFISIIIMTPITVAFYVFYLILIPLELIHVGVNKLYLTSQKEWRPTYGSWTRFTLKLNKAPKKITEKQVIEELHKREIPILPIIGIVLITIALFMQIS